MYKIKYEGKIIEKKQQKENENLKNNNRRLRHDIIFTLFFDDKLVLNFAVKKKKIK